MFDLKQLMMRLRQPRHSQERAPERGSVMVFVVIALGALVGIAAWATETGRMWQVKSQLQAVADTAALAGVGELLTNNFTTVDRAGALTAATTFGSTHQILGAPVTISGTTDVELGSWDFASQTFTVDAGTNPDVVRAVRVVARRDAVTNGPVPTILGAALGVASIPVNADGIGYWGFAGGAEPGVADLPIALDCCAISASSCTQNYCDTVTNTIPNECALTDSAGTATCLEFHSTPEQNACWTEFDGSSSSINTNDLTDLVETGNTTVIDGPIYLDNGTKTPVISEIKHRFEGTHGYNPAEGTDLDSDGDVDSWVVTLPVAECQNPGAKCATGSPQTIVGFVCFDIHEVDDAPNKIIRGSFLCTSDPRCNADGLTPGGTLPGGISVQYPVIVN